MADMNYSQDAGSYNLSTGLGPSFTAPAGMGDMSGFFERMAAKKAAEKRAAMEEDKRRWESEFRLKEQSMWQPDTSPRPAGIPPREMSLREQGVVDQQMTPHGLVDYVDPLNLKGSQVQAGMGGVYGSPGSRFHRSMYGGGQGWGGGGGAGGTR